MGSARAALAASANTANSRCMDLLSQNKRGRLRSIRQPEPDILRHKPQIFPQRIAAFGFVASLPIELRQLDVSIRPRWVEFDTASQLLHGLFYFARTFERRAQ